MKEFLYKYGLVIFLIITVSILAYQKEAVVTYQKEIVQAVPNQHVVISAILRTGQAIPVIIKKGLLNPENEGKTWLTLEDFKKKFEKRRPIIDNKNTFETSK